MYLKLQRGCRAHGARIGFQLLPHRRSVSGFCSVCPGTCSFAGSCRIGVFHFPQTFGSGSLYLRSLYHLSQRGKNQPSGRTGWYWKKGRRLWKISAIQRIAIRSHRSVALLADSQGDLPHRRIRIPFQVQCRRRRLSLARCPNLSSV